MAKNPQETASHTTASHRTGSLNPSRVSSPASTGGAGTFFEQHVAAYWLAQLLVQGIPPILHDCTIQEVHLQTEHLGWHTDDFLIVGQNGSGDRRQLAGQVKRTFTVSAADDECRKAVQDFWKDFRNPQQFSPTADRFALVTLRGTNTLLRHFSGLLDCSRGARDGIEFERRLATSGFISAKANQYCDEIRTIISETEGRSVPAAEVWPFLRVLHILSLDLNSATRQTEATIKTLLAHTIGEQDALGAADASWNALLREVSEGMPGAHSYRRDDLPEVLRRRHSLLGGTEQQVLRALHDHSELILSGIRSKIGSDLHLGRNRLVQQVIEHLESAQVVLISGTAGSGKSVVAKDAVSILADDLFVFSFRAEEFAHPHFNATLQSSQIPANVAALEAILASQDRKVLLVESMERLLEKSTRDAFTDLLTLVARDKSWQLVLTCRNYSTDLVRACFLVSASLGHSVITVPPLDDEELEEVRDAHPTLARPLANAVLCRLLRNPYFLDKALQIRWSEERPLPQSEWEFRALFWREIVRADHVAVDGMPRRREDAFAQIALRRARALTMHATCDDLDPKVVDSLRHDSLVVSSPQSNVLVAPAHDVLEDWAILHWIEEQHLMHEGSVLDLSTTIGTHPAVRRAYRKWVIELVERDPGTADGLFQAALRESRLPAQFCDDTLVSLLRSPSSVTFLERHSIELFANNKQLLQQVIHLLRVACVTTPDWLGPSAAIGSSFNMPDGPAWACVLQLVRTHLQSFGGEESLLLLGFIEDWARGVSWQTPYPEGAESVAAIAHWLLPGFDDYRSGDQRKRTLQVIAKIPNADRQRFAALLQGSRDDEVRDRITEDFREVILEGAEGMPAARDMPEAIVSSAKDYLLCSEDDLRREWEYGYGSDLELETRFGIKSGRDHGFFPASAYRGPFLHLLRYHPRQGLAFILDVFNHSADWYAHPRAGSEHVEPPFEMTLTFADGTSRMQWCNPRLWNLYRGTSVGPYVMQSLLMALEHWLLEFAEAQPHELDEVLLNILRRSDSAALTAVVASIATAYPHASGETLLVLLRSPLCILLDRHRFATESHATTGIFDFMGRFNAGDKLYGAERKEADARPHRRRDLENAIANLQLGPLAPRVHDILDQHRAKMPPVEEQDEDDRVWRLAMHRMDLRQYTIAEDTIETPVSSDPGMSTEKSEQYIRLNLKEPDPDVKEMADRSAAEFEAMNARLGLSMWGVKAFGREEDTAYDPDQWRQKLEEARASDGCNGGEEQDLGRDGPGFIAAVCVRDHWEEMSGVERDWCVDIVCSEVEREGDHWSFDARVQRNRMSADRPCAWIVPLLVEKPLNDVQASRVRRALVIASTHAIDEVRTYAVSGIGEHLWGIDRDLTLRCVNALATEATLVQQIVDAEKRRPYKKRRQRDEIELQATSVVRRRFFESNGIMDDAYLAMDPTTWFGAEANCRILAVLGQAPTEAVAISAFERLAHTLVRWWEVDDDRRRGEHPAHPRRNYQTDAALAELLKDFLLRTTTSDAKRIIEPIVGAIEQYPREVYWLLIGLISVEDRQPNTTQFWSLWEQFADGVRQATWLGRIDNEHSMGSEMISAIFLGTWWKEEVHHWRSLEGHAERVHALFEDLPASSTVLESYLRFLYHIGEQSLPEAFIRIAQRLRLGDPRQMLRKSNTVFLLEVLLQRYVYGKPLELKQRKDLREAVIFLLDLLVENGSSAAFRMRDDFVTPVSIT
jgi:hypothetical protein